MSSFSKGLHDYFVIEYLYELNGTTRDEEMNEIHVIPLREDTVDGRSRIARAQVYGGTWSGGTADPVLYNLEDHLGNSSFTLTDLGAEYSQEEYFPFGETSFGCYGKKRYRFCGKERDEESGLYYYGARYYAPWSCRFVSVDPLAGKYPFYTPYQYAGNKPVNFIDLDGLEPNDGKKNTSPTEGNPTPATTHTVEKGDTFWDLARNSGGKYTVHNLREWNPDVDPKTLQIGQVIHLSPNQNQLETPSHNLELIITGSSVNFEVAILGDLGIFKDLDTYFFIKASTDRTAKSLQLDDPNDMFEKYSIPNENTFRHALGSARITANYGGEYAKYVCNSHEGAGHSDVLAKFSEETHLVRMGYEVLIPDEHKFVDSFVDQLNNEVGREIGSISGISRQQTELLILDYFRDGKLFVFGPQVIIDDKPYNPVMPSSLSTEKYNIARKIILSGK